MGDRYDSIYSFILYSGILGFSFGILYDLFRIIRMAFTVPGMVHAKRKGRVHKSNIAVNILVFICDILFFVIAACITAIFIFHVNDGRIRGIALFGSLIGFVIYYNTVGRLVTRISSFIIKGIYFLFVFLLNRLLLPFFMLIFKGTAGLFYFLCDILDLFYTKRVYKRMRRALKKGLKINY